MGGWRCRCKAAPVRLDPTPERGGREPPEGGAAGVAGLPDGPAVAHVRGLLDGTVEDAVRHAYELVEGIDGRRRRVDELGMPPGVAERGQVQQDGTEPPVARVSFSAWPMKRSARPSP